MTARSFREPGKPPPEKPPEMPLPPRRWAGTRRPGPRETRRLALLALLAESEAAEAGQKS